MTEPQPYTVVRAFPGFDVRRYPESIQLQVRVRGDVTGAAGRGVRPLLRYLRGHNSSATRFALTAPVLHEEAGEDTHLVSVVLPGQLDPRAVPSPLDDAVTVRAVPTFEAAALRFRGGWSTRRFVDRGLKLLGQVLAADLLPDGPVYYARVDPKPAAGLLTRHEVLVRVTSA